MAAAEIVQSDAAAIARAVNAGRLDPIEVVEAFQGKIATRNGDLNALVRYTPETALAQARAIARRVAAGETLPLAGVPLVVKDNVFVTNTAICQGSRLFADHIAPCDAIAVERARAAGAVIIGIGNCPEFACKGQTNSPLHGIARNPHDVSLTPGGSSGGNAAAIAANFAPIGIGTDGGGSGRRPPAHTGTVGFKPSFGAIPYGPGFPEPFWGVATIAPMGRTVGDVAALFAAVAGVDVRDPDSTWIEPHRNEDTRSLRIAYSPRLGLDVPVDDDVANAIEAAIEHLRRAGWQIESAAPRWPSGLKEDALMPLQAGGLAALHGDAFKQDASLFDPDIAAQLERGLGLTAADVGGALEASAAIKRAVGQFFGAYDLLLCPTAPCVAWSVDRLGPSHIGGQAVGPRGHAVFTPFFNHALTPAISIPAGTGRAGLPVGLQIISRRGADWRVLQAAAAAEAILAAHTLQMKA
jgi:aspartyl-tRNA(Asn)/glutamyl-tRNA(Gln) amidotransferase subunit A